MQFLNEVLLEALDVFKNFQTSISSTRNLNFLFISIGSDFSKSETVIGHILQSGGVALNEESGLNEVVRYLLYEIPLILTCTRETP